MACSYTLAGISRDCDVNAGGIKRALIASYVDVVYYEVDSSTHMIDTITMDTGKYFHEYFQKPNVANYAGTPQFNDDGDYTGEDGILTLVFGRMDTTKRLEVEALSKQDLFVIYEDKNGKFWALGLDNAVTRNGGGTNSGTAQSDRNGYEVQLHSSDNGSPTEVDGSIIAALLPS